ncbi:substrate-binding domain-containing protein [Polaromonas jejuensis]|uniref:Substrate-binding domain-containing protein n=1 Tax=Polaromonas jejuensis TaxID=457502 RepID=A0ABW0Q746_9BURK|nr:substrate-binding domain-containing protein [Polaromonas jejuensis]
MQNRPVKRTIRAALHAAALLLAIGAQAAPPPSEGYRPQRVASGAIASVGDTAMQPLMDAWIDAFHQRQPGVTRSQRWLHVGDVAAVGALMFELADVAPMTRAPLPAELAPYAHQFAGDMMKKPLLVRVAWRGGEPAYLALNKRPDAPLAPKLQEFVRFALSRDGQEIVGRQAGFRALSAAEAAQELPKLDGFLATLDPALPPYRAGAQVHGDVRSVGSDGMKSLMERWMNGLHAVQPGVRRGERWEHLGTLNGFHALLAGETDLAPMGRELWPDEAAAYSALYPGQKLFEVRVARGGFNTPQRTTAQAIFVNANNPIGRITVPQLAAILGSSPTITRWGQLGLTGEWAERPIAIHMPPRVAPNAMSMQGVVLRGGAWNDARHEASIADTAKAIAQDPAAIGFGGFEEGGPGLKSLAVAASESGPYVEGNGETASSGRYPLTRYMYIRLHRKPGQALAPQVKEFFRYVLSREGQEPILYSGYFPLSGREVEEELAKLE